MNLAEKKQVVNDAKEFLRKGRSATLNEMFETATKLIEAMVDIVEENSTRKTVNVVYDADGRPRYPDDPIHPNR